MSIKKKSLHLTDNQIHLWVIKPQDITDSSPLKSLLNQQEIDKTTRYRQPNSQHTALVTRAFVRSVLSQYADVAEQEWQFESTALGKPEVKNAPLPIRFNLSHNNELVICAVCLTHNIGCDVESLTREISVQSIAKRYFSESEYQAILKHDKPSQNSAFFEYWTLKEAFVKATGLGISQGLNRFSFNIKEKVSGTVNSNIELKFSENCSEKNPQEWHNYLIYPDNTHCIGLSIQENNKTNKPFVIRLFDNKESLALFKC